MSDSSPSRGTWPRGFNRDTSFAWPLVRANDLVTLNYGKGLLEKNRIEGSVPVFGTNGQCGWHAHALTKGPGLILGRKGMGNLGVKWSPTDFWVIDTAYFVTPKVELDLKFFYYMIGYIGLNHLKDGTSNPSLSRDTFYAQLLPNPPLIEQQAIACVLGALDDKIELNQERNRTLEALSRAIFQSWFVNFDPVHAKAAGRKPAGFSKEIAALFPAAFVDSELGEIPKGWRVATMGELADVVGGGTPSTKDTTFWEGGTHHWATPKDLSPLSVPVLHETERQVTDAGLARIGSGLLPVGTVLMSSRAPIGYLAINQIPVAINQGFIAMQPRKGISAQFLLRWAASSQEAIVSRANGSTFLEISKSNFRPIQLVVPDDHVHSAFDRLVTPLFQQVVTLDKESRTLAALRNSLLPQLISGELRVPDAERIVGRAL